MGVNLGMECCFIVINYNGHYFLEKYLEGIALQCEKNNIDLIITDNNSTDLSVNFLRDGNYTYCETSRSARGFAANVNNGLAFARERKKYDYYIISNNDIEINPDLFEFSFPKLLEYLSKVKNIGIVGFDEILDDRIDYFKNFDFRNFSTHKILKVHEIPGFIFLITNELIDSIGYFDEEYFMYGEDNDFFYRASKAGFDIYNSFLPIRHFSESSSDSKKINSWLAYRNAFLFAQKNLSKWQYLILFLKFIYIIYYPYRNKTDPSNIRIRRSGFFYNNYFLIKAQFWNLKYFLNKKHEKRSN